MNNKRSQNVILVVSFGFILSSLLFQNCSSKLNSQIALSQVEGEINYGANDLKNVISFVKKPAPITKLVNDEILISVKKSLESEVARIEYQLTGQDDWIDNLGNQILLTQMAQGPHTIKVRAVLKNEQVSEIADYSWFVDNVKPAVTLTNPIETLGQEKDVAITFYIDETSSHEVSCQINGVMVPLCASPLTISDMPFGSTYDISIVVTDAAGNSSEPLLINFSALYLAPTYTSLNALIFSRRCTGCHNSVTLAGALDLTSYEKTVLSVVIPGDAINSKMYMRVTGEGLPEGVQRMPLVGGFLSENQTNTIRDWINAGAANN